MAEKQAFVTDATRLSSATALLVPLGPRDQFRLGDRWRFARDAWQHGQAVDEVNHYGIHRTALGDVLNVGTPEVPNATSVHVIGITMADFDRLTEADIAALGFADRAALAAEWGTLEGARGWLFAVAPTSVATVTLEEMAAMHDVSRKTISRHLNADQALPPDQRRIPGAYFVGAGKMGVWYIPLDVAKAWTPGKAGRPAKA
jgi:hypothetical protein